MSRPHQDIATAPARGWRSPVVMLMVMSAAMHFSFATWQALLNNFAVQQAGFSGAEIGILQSIREIPGFLAFAAVFLLFLFREQTLALLSLLALGFGTAATGLFAGDASMSPFELTHSGGSVEHMNPEPGALWLLRITDIHPSAVWFNPVSERFWSFTPTTEMIRQMLSGRMYPLTLEGLDGAMKELVR